MALLKTDKKGRPITQKAKGGPQAALPFRITFLHSIFTLIT
jgi:hypothetical protein